MNFDDFDYLNDPMIMWVGQFVHTDGDFDSMDAEKVLVAITEEYLPRFEAAIHKVAYNREYDKSSNR